MIKKTFKNLEEIQPYLYDRTYEFSENGKLFDVVFDFDFCSDDYSISANDLQARHIIARNIEVTNSIRATDINTNGYVIAGNTISTGIINSVHIQARHIKSSSVICYDLKAKSIESDNINAYEIKAGDIDVWDVCFAHKKFVCKTIKRCRDTSKYFCLNGDVVITGPERWASPMELLFYSVSGKKLWASDCGLASEGKN